ncbi:hypothetical protein NBRC116590_38920 [Pelagimonas sp. KU-00592-HH]
MVSEMAQNWNAPDERARAGMDPVLPVRAKIARRRVPADHARLNAELKQRIAHVEPAKSPVKTLSPVEKVMRRNAPDLAGGSQKEIRRANRRRRAHLKAKWPRPRVALLVAAPIMIALHPDGFVRMCLWALILFLVVSVVIGPERARDGALGIAHRFLYLFRNELVVARKIVFGLWHRIEALTRAAL